MKAMWISYTKFKYKHDDAMSAMKTVCESYQRRSYTYKIYIRD